MVRGAFEETATGWVYRSDAAPAVDGPVEAEPAWTAPSRRPRERFSPAQPRTASLGWIESGVLVMTLPLAITAGLMIAPVLPLLWVLGSRSRR